jgi:acylphosphatase
MPEARVHLIVKGRVQGVCYRMDTEDVARRLGLTGWVRNRRDRTVEIVAEGDKEKIEQLIQWCRRGPRLARVDDIEIEWQKPTGEFIEFRTTYTP